MPDRKSTIEEKVGSTMAAVALAAIVLIPSALVVLSFFGNRAARGGDTDEPVP